MMIGLGVLLNAQTGKVGIKTDKPAETLDVNGKTYKPIPCTSEIRVNLP